MYPMTGTQKTRVQVEILTAELQQARIIISQATVESSQTEA